MRPISLLSLLLALTSLLVSPAAVAHSAAGHIAGLAEGLMHPASGLDHLLITVAAGFWSARSGERGVAGLAYFLMLLLAGMLLGICCLQFSQLHLSTLLVMVLGMLFIVLAMAAPGYFGYIVFGSFALYHGIMHILEMTASMTSGYIVGMIISTGLLLLSGLVLRQMLVTCRPHSTTEP